MAGRRHCSRSATSPARCTRPSGRPAAVTLVQFGFDRERLYVRVDASRPVRRPAGRRARALAEVRQPGRRPVLGPADGGPADRHVLGPAGRRAALGRARSGRRRGRGRHDPRAGAAARRPRAGGAARRSAFFVAVYDDRRRRSRTPSGAPADRAAGAGRAVRSAALAGLSAGSVGAGTLGADAHQKPPQTMHRGLFLEAYPLESDNVCYVN